MHSERTKLQKAILIILLVMAVAFAVITGVVRSGKGIAFEDGLLYLGSEQGRTFYSGRIRMEDVTVTTYSEGETQAVELKVGELIDHTYRVEYPGGVIQSDGHGDYRRLRITLTDAYGRESVLLDGGYNPDSPFYPLCDANGEPAVGVYVSNGSWHNYKLRPMQVLTFAEGGSGTACRGDWLVYGMGVLVSLITALAAAFPEELFYLSHFMSVQDPEPTDFYMACQRVSWVIVTFAALIIYIVGATRIVT